MHSNWTYWDDRQHTEWCGAMIDSDHRTIRSLAARFDVPLLDTIAAWAPGARDTAFLAGRYYPMADADRDFSAIYPILEKQLDAMGDAPTYLTATAEAKRLDAMSMQQWLQTYVPGGTQSQLGRLIFEAYRNEYGREPSELSSINLVNMLGVQKKYSKSGGEINVLGYSNQRYTTATGNQRIPLAIAGGGLPAGSILFENRMTAMRRMPNGTYELTFDNAGTKQTEYYDRVILALPFIVLRGLDYSGAGFDSGQNQLHRQPRLRLSHQAARAVSRPAVEWGGAVAAADQRSNLDDAAVPKFDRLLARAERQFGHYRTLHGRGSGDDRHAAGAVRIGRRFAGRQERSQALFRDARSHLARCLKALERQSDVR